MAGLPNMQGMMKQIQKMQDAMSRIQAELETKTVVGEAGGGMVRVTANGKQHLTAITIDKEVVNPADVEITIEAFRRSHNGNRVFVCRDGEEALDFLFQRGKERTRQAGVSYLLLLDIRMPKVDGVEVLRQLKQDSELRKLPVIMVTTTDDPEDRKTVIQNQIDEKLAPVRAEVYPDPGLLDELTDNVERPLVIFGAFPEAYLSLPIEVLSTSDGRLVVVGQPEAPHHHGHRHDHQGPG